MYRWSWLIPTLSYLRLVRPHWFEKRSLQSKTNFIFWMYGWSGVDWYHVCPIWGWLSSTHHAHLQLSSPSEALPIQFCTCALDFECETAELVNCEADFRTTAMAEGCYIPQLDVEEFSEYLLDRGFDATVTRAFEENRIYPVQLYTVNLFFFIEFQHSSRHWASCWRSCEGKATTSE